MLGGGGGFGSWLLHGRLTSRLRRRPMVGDRDGERIGGRRTRSDLSFGRGDMATGLMTDTPVMAGGCSAAAPPRPHAGCCAPPGARMHQLLGQLAAFAGSCRACGNRLMPSSAARSPQGQHDGACVSESATRRTHPTPRASPARSGGGRGGHHLQMQPAGFHLIFCGRQAQRGPSGCASEP